MHSWFKCNIIVINKDSEIILTINNNGNSKTAFIFFYQNINTVKKNVKTQGKCSVDINQYLISLKKQSQYSLWGEPSSLIPFM